MHYINRPVDCDFAAYIGTIVKYYYPNFLTIQ